MENIYLTQSSADSFAAAIKYDRHSLQIVADTLKSYFLSKGRVSVRVLDVGSGTGAFILPLVQHFGGEPGLDWSLDCFDISGHMISLFEGAMMASGVPQGRVTCIRKDAEEGLTSSYPVGSYDLVTATFVLHYIGNWQSLLDDVEGCLKDGGLFLTAEIAGEMRSVDGSRGGDPSTPFALFWEQYFRERAEYAEWKPLISVSNIGRVLDDLGRRGAFGLYEQREFLWTVAVRWGELCEWIRASPVSSLGAGIDGRARLRMSERMRVWLRERGLSESDEVKVRWGFKISILTRRTRRTS